MGTCHPSPFPAHMVAKLQPDRTPAQKAATGPSENKQRMRGFRDQNALGKFRASDQSVNVSRSRGVYVVQISFQIVCRCPAAWCSIKKVGKTSSRPSEGAIALWFF
ncbi:MAG: hypothetical protein QOG58_3865 [Caballeronia sp.]|jgi:hypothetical protein|nr:hypothetical protein [Caballeronia sp.]